MPDEDILDLMEIPDRNALNPDLAEYAKEHSPPAAQTRQEGPAGTCHLCGAQTRKRCLRCDRPACTNHHHVMYGLCQGCAHHDGSGPEDDERRPDLDIPWVE